MPSDYLRNTPRSGLQIARDSALDSNVSWEQLCYWAEGFNVMVALTGQSSDDTSVVFSHVGGTFRPLTGYGEDELIGRDPALLQCRETNLEEASRLMSGLEDSDLAEIKIINQRKSGELYGCHIVAARMPVGRFPGSTYFAALGECALEDCP